MSKLKMEVKFTDLNEVMKLNDSYQFISKEIDRLALFISENFADEPGKTGESESAVDVAIRLLKKQMSSPHATSEVYREG